MSRVSGMVGKSVLLAVVLWSGQGAEAAEVGISRVRDQPQPATTVKDWLVQVEAATVQVTNVKVDRTDAGLDITLETADGKLLQVDATQFRTEGNSLIADIPNAVLRLTDAEAFTVENPTADVASVQVVQPDSSRIRISVTGNNAPPRSEVVLKTGNLEYSLNPEAEEPDEEIVVTGEGQRGYRVPNASTATRTDTPIRDIPQSIQVVPQEVLRDRNVRTLREAVETVSGVVDGGYLSGAPAGSRIIRGFNQAFDGGAANFRNGYRDSNYGDLTGIGTIERVEVLKGPASVLFGAVEPGGIVNTVTKQPLSTPYYKLAFEAGNYRLYQPSLDFSGPLDANKNVLYRFIASYQDSGSYQPFVDLNLTTIAPSVTLRLGDRTKLNLYYEYIHFFADPFITNSLVLSDGSLTPQNLYGGYPNINLFDITTQRAGYTLNHEFNDSWQLRNNLAVTWSDTVERRVYATGTELVDDRFLEVAAGEYRYASTNYFGQVDLLGKFKTGAISHQLLFGFDFNRFINPLTGIDYVNVPTIDILNPDYGFSPTATAPLVKTNRTTQSYGIYLQDQIAFSDNFKLLIGGRYDWISDKNETADFGRFGNTTDEPVQRDGAFSPRVGLVYQPSKSVSLYASYSSSLSQNTGFNPDGRAFEPTRGTQYEVGIKTDFLDGRLSTTLAAYHLTKTNVNTTDPSNPLFSIQTGEQRSRGIELDVTGEILPGWRVIASYAYTDAEVTADNVIPVGNRLRGVPENQASLWTTYQIQGGALRGLGFGLGLFYVGERQGNLTNSFQVEGYLRTDAALYYRRDRFNAAINIRNLFDIDYVSFPIERTNVHRGDPFTIIGSIGWEF